jgi:hypothetical protein
VRLSAGIPIKKLSIVVVVKKVYRILPIVLYTVFYRKVIGKETKQKFLRIVFFICPTDEGIRFIISMETPYLAVNVKC